MCVCVRGSSGWCLVAWIAVGRFLLNIVCVGGGRKRHGRLLHTRREMRWMYFLNVWLVVPCLFCARSSSARRWPCTRLSSDRCFPSAELHGCGKAGGQAARRLVPPPFLEPGLVDGHRCHTIEIPSRAPGPGRRATSTAYTSYEPELPDGMPSGAWSPVPASCLMPPCLHGPARQQVCKEDGEGRGERARHSLLDDALDGVHALDQRLPARAARQPHEICAHVTPAARFA